MKQEPVPVVLGSGFCGSGFWVLDSDGICLPDRFEKQLAYLEAHPKCDIVGGQMTEFIETPDNIIGRREVPLTNEEIYQYMKSRSALNHVTVMFRKEAV